MGIVDEVIPEPLGGAHRNHRQMATSLKGSLCAALQQFDKFTPEQLVDHRYERFRKIGVFEEVAV